MQTRNAGRINAAITAAQSAADVLGLSLKVTQYETDAAWVVSLDFWNEEVLHNVMLFFRGRQRLGLSAISDGHATDPDFWDHVGFRAGVNRELAHALRALPLSGAARAALEETAEQLHNRPSAPSECATP